MWRRSILSFWLAAAISVLTRPVSASRRFVPAGENGLSIGRELDASNEAVPTKQPPSLGQDQLRCGFLMLPERILLAPDLTSFIKKSGDWQNTVGATFTQWSQYAFSWDDSTAYFYIDSKLFFKSEHQLYPTEGLHEQHLGMRLPEDEKGEFNVVALKDCDGAILYVLRAHRSFFDYYEIYNRLGELVATSYNGEHFEDQMQFRDETNIPIAMAQSPVLTVQKIAEDHVHIDREPPGTPEPWEIAFMGYGYNSNSSLLLAQNRWVIAAVVQDRAIRDASRAAPCYGHVFFLVAVLLVIAGLLAVFSSVLLALYKVVFGESTKQRQAKAGNPFIDRLPSGVYGAAA